MDELKRIVSGLESMLSDLNVYNALKHPDEDSKEAKTLESIYVNIREQKEELEYFIEERG